MSIVGVLDYGAGNLRSVSRAIEHMGFSYKLISEPIEMDNIDKLIIPGVGAFKAAMNSLEARGFVTPVKEYTTSGQPLLGICLGMQLLFDISLELGETRGLGLIAGSIENIPVQGNNEERYKVPHIGWNELITSNDHSSLFKDSIENSPAVYFVHSFMAHPLNQSDVVAYCNYANVHIPAVVCHENVYGCQFHPEKSGEVGLKILSRFISE